MSSPKENTPPSTKPSQTASTKPSRLPAPTLFVGPPSRNTSQLSVARPNPNPDAARQIRDPLNRQRSALSRPFDTPATEDGDPVQTTKEARLRKASEQSVERRWRAMQNTLDEVEMTAQTGTHVFGPSHAGALDELRRAQVELARAWGRGSEETGLGGEEGLEGEGFMGVHALAQDRVDVSKGTGGKGRQRAATDASASTVLSDESLRTESGSGGGAGSGGGSARSLLEDETAEDIRRASERRAANERYFSRVEASVGEVVEKLGVVAEAMRGVEGESRSLWSGSESLESSGDGQEDGQVGRGEPIAVK